MSQNKNHEIDIECRVYNDNRKQRKTNKNFILIYFY